MKENIVFFKRSIEMREKRLKKSRRPQISANEKLENRAWGRNGSELKYQRYYRNKKR